MRRALLALTVAFSVLALAPSVFACHHGDKKACKKPSTDAATTQPSPDAVKPAPAPEAPAAVATPPAAPTTPANTDGKHYKVDDFGTEELPEAGK